MLPSQIAKVKIWKREEASDYEKIYWVAATDARSYRLLLPLHKIVWCTLIVGHDLCRKLSADKVLIIIQGQIVLRSQEMGAP